MDAFAWEIDACFESVAVRTNACTPKYVNIYQTSMTIKNLIAPQPQLGCKRRGGAV
jgi:hypothetical protein